MSQWDIGSTRSFLQWKSSHFRIDVSARSRVGGTNGGSGGPGHARGCGKRIPEVVTLALRRPRRGAGYVERRARARGGRQRARRHAGRRGGDRQDAHGRRVRRSGARARGAGAARRLLRRRMGATVWPVRGSAHRLRSGRRSGAAARRARLRRATPGACCFGHTRAPARHCPSRWPCSPTRNAFVCSMP